MVAQGSLVLLTGAHALSGPIPELKARSLLNVGKCFRLLSVLRNPDPPSQWNAQDMNLLNIAAQVTPDEEDDDFELTTRQKERYRNTIARMQRSSQTSSRYLATATECLTQAVNLAIKEAVMNVASAGALELVECIGQFDTGLATQYLALHQVRYFHYCHHLMSDTFVLNLILSFL